MLRHPAEADVLEEALEHLVKGIVDFFAAHKVEAAERTYKQSIERINNCVSLKSQQESQLASWLGGHGAAGGK